MSVKLQDLMLKYGLNSLDVEKKSFLGWFKLFGSLYDWMSPEILQESDHREQFSQTM